VVSFFRLQFGLIFRGDALEKSQKNRRALLAASREGAGVVAVFSLCAFAASAEVSLGRWRTLKAFSPAVGGF
jgi:hypothetical protein